MLAWTLCRSDSVAPNSLRSRASDRLIERAAGEAERGSPDRCAENVKGRHGDTKTLACFANHRSCGDARILKPDAGERMRGDHPDALDNQKARRIRRHDKGGNPLRARRFAGAGKDHIEIGNAAVRYPGLFPIEDVIAAVTRCRHGDVCHIRTRFCLRQCERRDGGTGPRPLQPLSLCYDAEQADGARAKPLHGEREIGESIVARQRLTYEAQRPHVVGAARLWVGGRMHEPPVTAERRDEYAAGSINIAAIDRQVRPAPYLDRGAEFAMPLLEKRPGEETLVGHQLPSNAGRSFATNAR